MRWAKGGWRGGHEVFTHHGPRNPLSRRLCAGCGDCPTTVVYPHQRRCRPTNANRRRAQAAGTHDEEHRAMRRSLPQRTSGRMPPVAARGWSPRSVDGPGVRHAAAAVTASRANEPARDREDGADGIRRAGLPENAAACRGARARQGSADPLCAWCAVGASGIGVGKGVCAPVDRVTLPIRPIHRSFTWADEGIDATYCAVWDLWLLPPGRCPPGIRIGRQPRRNWHMNSMAVSHPNGQSKGRLRC
jgi:hypothetical protein